MRRLRFQVPGQALAIAFLSVVAIGAIGCGSNGTPLPTPPKDTVTFPPASTRAWLQQYGSGTTIQYGDIAYGVATDSQGDVFLLDQSVGAFPGFSNPGNAPEFAVVKFNSSGTRVWTQQLGTGLGDYPYAIATDSLGNIVVVGYTNGAFPGFTNPNRYSEGVVIKLDPSGQVVWIQQSPSTGPNRVTTVAVDPLNNVIVGGNIPSSRGNTIIGGYVSKLNAANGQPLWTKGTNGNGSYYYLISGVAADAEGNVFAVGQFPGSNTSGGSTLYQAAKFNGLTGQVLWTQVSATANGIPSYTAIAVGPTGNVFLGGINRSTGYNQCVIANLANASGSTAWTQSFGAAQSCIPGGIAADTAGNVLLTGDVIGSFSTTSATAMPFQQDIFLAKLNSAGQGVWVQQYGTGNDNPIVQNGTVALTFVATDSENRADIGGTTQGAFSGFSNPKGINQLFATQFAP